MANLIKLAFTLYLTLTGIIITGNVGCVILHFHKIMMFLDVLKQHNSTSSATEVIICRTQHTNKIRARWGNSKIIIIHCLFF